MVNTRFALLVGLLLLSIGSVAQAADTWSYPVRKIDPPRRVGTDDPKLSAESVFTALEAKGHKKNQLCMLLPQTSDTVFLSYMYGAVSEAERLGQALTIFDAGGVENASQQRAQLDNCVTLGGKGIIIETSLAGWSLPVKQAQSQGVKVVEFSEPLDTPSDGRSLGSYLLIGQLMGEVVAKEHPAGGKPANVLILPGMAGLKFCEDTVKGIKKGLEGSSAAVVDVMYGGLDSASQLKLVEDALVAHPDVDYILANGTAIPQAAKVLRQRGMTGKVKLISNWLDPDIGEGIKSGEVLGAATESSTIVAKIAINLVVAAIEGEKAVQDIVPAARLVTKENIDDKDIQAANYAPEGWKPVFQVK